VIGQGLETDRRRAARSGTDKKTGSSSSSGSPGKYICVISRAAKPVPKNEKWMWFGRHAL